MRVVHTMIHGTKEVEMVRFFFLAHKTGIYGQSIKLILSRKKTLLVSKLRAKDLSVAVTKLPT